jgi:pimeloyl-ACP methyl ester carboxylesterase
VTTDNDQRISDSGQAFSTGSVVSADGTTIGYRQLGTGPGVVLLHGSMQSAASHMQLATALADSFTVYLPDRRGRGESGPYGDDYAIAREVADLAAVLGETGARNVFGVSASGIVVLQAALSMPGCIDKVAVYEPALVPAGSDLTDWIPRFDAEMARGDIGAAMVTSMIGFKLGPGMLKAVPRGLLARLTEAMLRSEDKKAAPGTVTMRMLAPTIRYEGQIVAEMTGTLDTFGGIAIPVLLLGGSKGLSYLKPALADLERVVPGARRVEFAGLDHGGAADVSKANPKGKPEVVAAELRRFFG